MRQNRPFPIHPQPQPEPPPPPSRLDTLRKRVAGFFVGLHNAFLVLMAVLITMAGMLLYENTKPPPQHLTQRDIDAAVQRSLDATPPKPSFASQANEVIQPSVVRVQTMVLKDGSKVEGGIGTGVVVSDSGLILTCLHVVQDAAEIDVVFSDGSESVATVVTKQPENDLAVLRPDIIPDDLVPATLTSSGSLRIGDEVIAVGNPFGLSNSLSDGVVSGLGRNIRSPKTGETYNNLIQFDTAVNPGNSGGPLVNRDGEVVGIVTMLLNPTDQDVFIGIGFAVPIETGGALAGSPPY